MQFNDWLAGKKRERGLSNKAIAEAVGVTSSTVGRWLKGERVPGRAQVGGLALLFQVSPVTILRMIDKKALDEEVSQVERQQSLAELLAYVPELGDFVELMWRMTPERRAAIILLARSAAGDSANGSK